MVSTPRSSRSTDAWLADKENYDPYRIPVSPRKAKRKRTSTVKGSHKGNVALKKRKLPPRNTRAVMALGRIGVLDENIIRDILNQRAMELTQKPLADISKAYITVRV